MRTKQLQLILLVLFTLSIIACYKTGEIIPQPFCKPIEVAHDLYMYGQTGVAGYKRAISYQPGSTRVSQIDIRNASNQLTLEIHFEYDVNHNLVRYYAVDFPLTGTPRTYWYMTFSYPFGTQNSYSDYLYAQAYFLNGSGTYDGNPVELWEFNTEFQLVRMSQNGVTNKTYEYDFGGNLIRNNNYQSNSLYTYWTFQSYDTQVNFARADRSLQLYFNIYSKNNPTEATEVSLAIPDGKPQTTQYVGSYQYLPSGYPTSYNGNFLATYQCQ